MSSLSPVEAIFYAALEKPSMEERSAYLDEACRGDAALRERIERLLKAQPEVGSFLQGRPQGMPLTTDDLPISEGPGTQIGPYKLMEQIGEGGMGLVFVAEQHEPVRRKVALKVIKPGMDTRVVIARFEAERQALALMDHPNIAKILDAGTTGSGRPFFVMELVKGVPITEYCDQNQLTPRERMALFATVCQAVQHAHTKGVIHRDLKPSNVLVTLHDGTPVVKVIDFGVAKAIGQQLTENTIYTRFTQMIGTPVYMSPEQAEMSGLDIDMRSDVYSLGVLLYELLTGTTPFDRQRMHKAAFDEIRRIIREEEPPKPSARLTTLGDGLSVMSAKRKTEPGKLSALFTGDLDWIVMKALEKDRTRRYDTASALAADVRRFLSEEPVEARPPSAWYRARKMARRNKAAMMTAGLVAAALLLGIVGTTVGLLRAVDAEAEAVAARDDETRQRVTAEEQRRLAIAAAADASRSEQLAKENELKATESASLAIQQQLRAVEQESLAKAQAEKAEWGLYSSHIASAQSAWENNDLPLFDHHLKLCREDFRGWEYDYLYTLVNQNCQTLQGHMAGVQGLAFSPDGKLLASSAAGEKDVKLWDAIAGTEIRTLQGHTQGISDLAFSPDGKYLASASAGFSDKTAKIWEVATGRIVLDLKHKAVVECVAFSPDGKTLATGGFLSVKNRINGIEDGTVNVYDVSSGKAIMQRTGHSRTVRGVAFSPDGKRLVSTAIDAVIILDPANGKELARLKGDMPTGYNSAFSPDGKRLATGGRTARIWDPASGNEMLALQGHTDRVRSVAFSPDGKFLASASSDKTVKLWDAFAGKELQTLKGHMKAINRVVFSPDGKRLATASEDKTIKLWDLSNRQLSRGIVLKSYQEAVRQLAFSPDSTRLASVGPGQRPKSNNSGKFKDLEVARGLHFKLWDVTAAKEVLDLRLHANGPYGVLRSPGPACTVSPDGNILAGLIDDGTVGLWNTATGKILRTIEVQPGAVYCLCFSPDGKRLATGCTDKLVRLLDVETGKEVRRFPGHTSYVNDVVFNVDGTRLASASRDQTVKVWDTITGNELFTLRGHRNHIDTIVFSPDSKRLVSTSQEEPSAFLWDLTDKGKTILPFKTRSMVFSPDSKYLAAASQSVLGKTDLGLIKVLDAVSGRTVLSIKAHADQINSVVISPDGKRIASGSHDKTVKVWNAANGQELLSLSCNARVQKVAFSPDGKRLAGAATDTQGSSLDIVDGTITIWDASKSMKELDGK